MLANRSRRRIFADLPHSGSSGRPNEDLVRFRHNNSAFLITCEARGLLIRMHAYITYMYICMMDCLDFKFVTASYLEGKGWTNKIHCFLAPYLSLVNTHRAHTCAFIEGFLLFRGVRNTPIFLTLMRLPRFRKYKESHHSKTLFDLPDLCCGPKLDFLVSIKK